MNMIVTFFSPKLQIISKEIKKVEMIQDELESALRTQTRAKLDSSKIFLNSTYEGLDKFYNLTEMDLKLQLSVELLSNFREPCRKRLLSLKVILSQ